MPMRITASGFLKWMKGFVERVNPTKESPVLLILDGHSSHKNLELILYARDIFKFQFFPFVYLLNNWTNH